MPLAQALSRFLFIIFNAACLRCKEKPRNVMGHKGAAPGLASDLVMAFGNQLLQAF